jgi:hypothetical protein
MNQSDLREELMLYLNMVKAQLGRSEHDLPAASSTRH